MKVKSEGMPRAWRSRWAAVGAAVAVTLGAGGMVAVNAAPSAPSSVITVEPTRILDTRTNVGLSSPPASGNSQKLQVTGIVPTQPPGGAPAENVVVVPAGATAVVLNATVVRPATKGFLSIRPGDATGFPATSNINWAAGGANIANSITVQLPASGQVDVFVNGTVGEVLIDVAGYMIPATGGTPGPEGPEGPAGPSNAFASQVGGGVNSTTTNSDFTTLSVPAGSYIVSAKLYGIASSVSATNPAGERTMLCYIFLDGSTQVDFTNSDTDPEDYENLSLTGAVTLTEPGVLSLTCQAGPGPAAHRVFGISLTAIQVGSLTDSSTP